MGYQALEAVIAGRWGPVPLHEAIINSLPRRVFGSLPGNLLDYHALVGAYGDKSMLIGQDRRHNCLDVLPGVITWNYALADRYEVCKGSRVASSMRSCCEWFNTIMAIVAQCVERDVLKATPKRVDPTAGSVVQLRPNERFIVGVDSQFFSSPAQ